MQYLFKKIQQVSETNSCLFDFRALRIKMSKILFLFLALLLAFESNALNLINKDDKDLSKDHQRVQRALIVYQPWLTVSIQVSTYHYHCIHFFRKWKKWRMN